MSPGLKPNCSISDAIIKSSMIKALNFPVSTPTHVWLDLSWSEHKQQSMIDKYPHDPTPPDTTLHLPLKHNYMVCYFVCLMCTRLQASGLMQCADEIASPAIVGTSTPTSTGDAIVKNDRTISPVMRRRSARQFKFNLRQTSMSTIHERFQIHAKCFQSCSLTDK